MRALALFVVLALAGCTRFEHPIVGEGGPALDPALVGAWEVDTEEAHVVMRIEPDGDAGAISITGEKEGEAQKEERYRLITSRIGQLTYASVQDGEPSSPGEAPGSWFYFRYELPSPERLILYGDDEARWQGAVHDGLVSGNAPADSRARNVTVTASGAELRRFLEGYGAVIFKDEADVEFHRAAR